MPRYANELSKHQDRSWNLISHFLEHFKIGSRQEELGLSADCDRADWKGRTSLRHLLEASEGANHLPYGPGRRWSQLADRCAIAVFAV